MRDFDEDRICPYKDRYDAPVVGYCTRCGTELYYEEEDGLCGWCREEAARIIYDEEEAAKIAEEKRLAYNARMREYIMRRYHEDPEFRQTRLEYNHKDYKKNREKRIAHNMERLKDPAVRARHNETAKRWYQRHKDDPGFMEKRRAAARQRYLKKKEAMQNDG